MVGERRTTYDKMHNEGYATIEKVTRRGKYRSTHYIGYDGIEYALELYVGNIGVRTITIYGKDNKQVERYTK